MLSSSMAGSAESFGLSTKRNRVRNFCSAAETLE